MDREPSNTPRRSREGEYTERTRSTSRSSTPRSTTSRSVSQSSTTERRYPGDRTPRTQRVATDDSRSTRSYESRSSGERSTRGDSLPRQTITRGRNNRRKSGPPLIPIVIGAVVVIALIVVLVMVFTGKEKEGNGASKNPASTTSTVSTSGAAPGAVSGATETPAASAAPTPTPAAQTPEVPTGNPETLDGLFIIGDTAFEYYNFVEDTANQYITVISNGGKRMAQDGAKVYNMIIPTSIDIKLPESLLTEQKVNSSDQKEAIDYINSSINAQSPEIKTIPIIDAMRQHANEYIYFRTDHHWTQLGAYYAYREFCNAKGIAPLELDQYDKKSYPGYLGSFYSTESRTEMANNPDTVDAYIPKEKGNATAEITQADGTVLEDWSVVADGTDYGTDSKYLIFIGGDQPLEVITNPDINDGSSCMLVKESFGNAFAPLLTPHYQTVYVVDYRHYEGNIADLAKEKKVQDVIMLNNISMTRNADLVERISTRF